MKQRWLPIAGCLVLGTTFLSAYQMYFSDKSDYEDDLLLANIEALTDNELSGMQFPRYINETD